MRYAKKRDDDSMDWQIDEERTRERLVRLRRREAPMSPRVTRKMARIDAELLALARREELRASCAPTRPPPRQYLPAGKPPALPPPLPIAFPFPFANTASTTMPSVAVLSSSDDTIINVHDSWLLPPHGTVPPDAGLYQSLVPREPDPFTVAPPAFSLPPRR